MDTASDRHHDQPGFGVWQQCEQCVCIRSFGCTVSAYVFDGNSRAERHHRLACRGITCWRWHRLCRGRQGDTASIRRLFIAFADGATFKRMNTDVQAFSSNAAWAIGGSTGACVANGTERCGLTRSTKPSRWSARSAQTQTTRAPSSQSARAAMGKPTHSPPTLSAPAK